MGENRNKKNLVSTILFYINITRIGKAVKSLVVAKRKGRSNEKLDGGKQKILNSGLHPNSHMLDGRRRGLALLLDGFLGHTLLAG
jgi:hypothetical protein